MMRRWWRWIVMVFMLGCNVMSPGCVSAPQVARAPEETFVPRIFLEPFERAVLPDGAEVRKVYPKGIMLTSSMEGYRARLYDDPAGNCTIGYGHLVKKSRCDGSEPQQFKKGLSRSAGLELLQQDMEMAEITVMKAVRVDLTDGQYAALCDFVYNAGPTRFRKSDLLKHVNAGRHEQVPSELRRYVKANKRVLQGLVQRREKEIELFFEGLPTTRAVPNDEELPLIDLEDEVLE